MEEFTGKKLLVVGGTSGIGRAVAALVRRGGGEVVVIGRREERLAEVVESLGVIGIATDLNDRAAVASLCERLGHEHGDIDLLV
ncbi:MAG: SDR family NAD(P)-dependent oxidoreductase, partial [Acidobacteriota bacterium]